MLNPFRKPEGGDDRWKRLVDYLRPSARDEQEAVNVLGEANEFLAWSNQPYHRKFIVWLRDQADAPAEIADHLTMVGNAARSDAFRRILTHLKELEARARIATGG